MSSAYKTVLKVEPLTMSLICITNSKGPMIDPWGMPHHVALKKILHLVF